MRDMSVDVPVRTPAGFALAFVRTYFEERARDPASHGLDLGVSLGAIAAGLRVEKSVDARLAFVRGPGGENFLEISWHAAHGAAFPHFTGAISATPAGDEACRLALTGRYAPPGGVAGSIFDAALGGRIARSTIGELLTRLAAAAETDYRIRLAM